MALYTFKEIITYFLSLLKLEWPNKLLEDKEPIEMEIDQFHVVLCPLNSGGIKMQLNLGLLLRPIRQDKLKTLCQSNFLGVDTGGCTLALDQSAVSLFLKVATTSNTTPQENWEFLHRLINVAKAWQKKLIEWEEFVPLAKESFL